MEKQDRVKLKNNLKNIISIHDELQRRNAYALLKYNSGEKVHKKQLDFTFVHDSHKKQYSLYL